MTNKLSERDISDYKESERNAGYIKRKFLSNDSKCEHRRIDFFQNLKIDKIKRELFPSARHIGRSFGHKTIESKPITE